MIKTFKDRTTEDVYNGLNTGQARKLPVQLQNIMRRKLDMLDAATMLDDLRSPPGNRLEKLKRNLAGYWSIRVNDQFRVVFEWKDGNAFEVQITDYH